MALAFTNPATRAFLNTPQQQTPSSYHEAAAAPWSFPVPGAAATSNTAAAASHPLAHFPASPPRLGIRPNSASGGAPVWYAATVRTAQEGGSQTLAASLPSVAVAGAHDQGVHLRALEAPSTSVAPSIAYAAPHRPASDFSVRRAATASAAAGSRPASPAATDSSSGADAARLTGIDARRAGARYGVIPAWATESGTPRGRSARRLRMANTPRSPSRSPTRQTRDGSENAAEAVPGRFREGMHDAGKRIDGAMMSDLIYFVTSTSVGTRRVLNRMEQQSVIVSNQQRQVQCVLNRIAVHGDMALQARQEAVQSEEDMKEKLDAITTMLKEKLLDEDEDETDITEEDKAAWVLDVAVSSSLCLHVTGDRFV